MGAGRGLAAAGPATRATRLSNLIDPAGPLDINFNIIMHTFIIHYTTIIILFFIFLNVYIAASSIQSAQFDREISHMNKEREAYYRLSELFAVLVPKALRGFLQSKMKASERVRGYAHSLAWWEDNKGKLPRASLTGGELHVLDPENWEMNMLLKVIKYSDFDLLERYEEEWSALDDLIEARRIVFGNTAGKKVSPHDADECFRIVSDALGILGQVGEMENVKTIKKSMRFIIIIHAL